MSYNNRENSKELPSASDSSRSNSNRSHLIQNHICYLHSNPEVICASCLKKLVLEKKLNINIVSGSIADYKRTLNVILERSIHFDKLVEEPARDNNHIGEIQVLRSQAIQIRKNNMLKQVEELRSAVKKATERKVKLQLQIDQVVFRTSANSSMSEPREEEKKDTFKQKAFSFYKKYLGYEQNLMVMELVSLLNLQKNPSNNYYYICNKTLPLPKYLSKTLRIQENNNSFNKKLFLLIEHLSKFLEVVFVVYFNRTDFDLSKMTLNMVFVENNKDNKIFITIVRKMTLIIFILVKIEISKSIASKRDEETSISINVNEQDFLGKLISKSLMDLDIKEDYSIITNLLYTDTGTKIPLGSSDAEIMETVKNELLELLM